MVRQQSRKKPESLAAHLAAGSRQDELSQEKVSFRHGGSKSCPLPSRLRLTSYLQLKTTWSNIWFQSLDLPQLK